MMTRAVSLARIGGILFLLACQSSGPPHMEDALTLYREGQINAARRELLAYIAAYPTKPESDDARQRILLIRRIKALEAETVALWRHGDLEAARRTLGVMRVLHPVYVDSTSLFRSLDLEIASQSFVEAAAGLQLIDPGPFGEKRFITGLPMLLNDRIQPIHQFLLLGSSLACC